MPDAFEHCEELVRAGDKDRFLATLFAPQKYRRALYVLYAFNHEIARIRDVSREPMAGEIRLQWWRDVIAGGGHGDVAAHPVAAALREVVVRYRLPPATLTDLIDARSFDLYDDPMESLSDLDRYAVRTSSALIGLAARILADGKDFSARDLMDHGGVAYAIAGLLRALPLHAARRQLYIPIEVLQRYGATAEDVFAGNATTEVRSALAELRLRARRHLDVARPMIATLPSALAPALLPVALVRPALDRMEHRRYRPIEPGDLPQWRRQWALWRAARSDLRKGF
jgi:phytoene synthase